MSPHAKTLLLAAAACALGSATRVMAQEPPAPQASQALASSAPVTAPAQPEPVKISPAEEGLSERALQLNDLDQRLAIAVKTLQLANTAAQQQEAEQKLGMVRSGRSSVPELVGVTGVGRNLTAEFLSNNALVRVGAGDYVTEDWKVEAISASTVTLLRRGGKQRTTIQFGHKPQAPSDPAQAMPRGPYGQPGTAPATSIAVP